jgi:hypothetical protein
MNSSRVIARSVAIWIFGRSFIRFNPTLFGERRNPVDLNIAEDSQVGRIVPMSRRLPIRYSPFPIFVLTEGASTISQIGSDHDGSAGTPRPTRHRLENLKRDGKFSDFWILQESFRIHTSLRVSVPFYRRKDAKCNRLSFRLVFCR